MQNDKKGNEGLLYIPQIDYKARGYQAIGKPPTNDMCGGCETYYKLLYDKGLTDTPFPPRCSKHVLEPLKHISAHDFDSEQDYEDTKLLIDPVAWAYSEFEWEPRWYQDWMLSCTSDLKLYRCGRRLGKTEGLIIETLHFLFTHSECTIIMCAPREKQVTRFFDELGKFIRKGQTIRGSIARHVKSPARMEFKNNSKILGFTLNPNQGDSASVNVRGQDANLIVVDELDFIADKDLDVLFAIKASHADCKIIAATTPSGQRNKFYKMVVDKNIGWKEFWFISQESPTFTAATEKFFKDQFNETDYTHEVYAEFGEPADGVFKKKHIDKSLRQYDMNSIPVDINGKYILGIDWNKSHGTHMIIIQHVSGSLALTRKIVVPESEYMQSESVEMIIDLHNKWRFKYIFVDAGYGATQVEYLKKHGLQNPRTRLHEIVKPITMNQSILVKDPHTGEDIRKFTKPYLVQQTAKLMEDNKLILPMDEDTSIVDSKQLMGLVQQIRNYRVTGYSVYGQPQYSKENDHTITAYMLACAGYVLEAGDLASLTLASSVRGIQVDSDAGIPAIGDLWTEEDYRKYQQSLRNKEQSSVPVRDLDSIKKTKNVRKIEGVTNAPKKTKNIKHNPGSSYRRKNF